MGARPNKGYKLTIDPIKKILTICAWGMWDKALAETYFAEYKQKATEISAKGGPWYVLVDYRDFPPQSKEVQEIIKQAMLFSKSHGVTRQARMMHSTVTSMQIKRLSQETNLPENAHFTSEEEAVQWLLHH